MSPILPLYTQLPTPGHGSDEAEGLLARQAEATVPSYASTGTPSATPTPAVGVAVAPPVYPVPLELSRITLESRSGNTIAQAVGRRGATRKGGPGGAHLISAPSHLSCAWGVLFAQKTISALLHDFPELASAKAANVQFTVLMSPPAGSPRSATGVWRPVSDQLWDDIIVKSKPDQIRVIIREVAPSRSKVASCATGSFAVANSINPAVLTRVLAFVALLLLFRWFWA